MKKKLLILTAENDLSSDRRVAVEFINSLDTERENNALFELTALNEVPQKEELCGADILFIFINNTSDAERFSIIEALLDSSFEDKKLNTVVFVKKTDNERLSKEAKGLVERLTAELSGCFFTYDDNDWLKLAITASLCAVTEGLTAQCRGGELIVNKKRLIKLESLPAFCKNKDLARLKKEYERAKGEFTVAQKAHDETGSKEARLTLHSAAKKLFESLEEKEDAEASTLNYFIETVRTAFLGGLSASLCEAQKAFERGDVSGACAALGSSDTLKKIDLFEKNGDVEEIELCVGELIARALALSSRGFSPERNNDIEQSLGEAVRLEIKYNLPRRAQMLLLERKINYKDITEAEKTAKELLRCYEQRKTEEHHAYIRCLVLLANIKKSLLKADECEDICRQLIEIITPLYKDNSEILSEYLIQALTMLCEINLEKSEPKAAVELAIIIAALPDNAKERSPRSLLASARALGAAGRHGEALKALEAMESDLNNATFEESIENEPLLCELLVTKGEIHLSLFDFFNAYNEFMLAKEKYEVFPCESSFGGEDLCYRLYTGQTRALLGYKLKYSEAYSEASRGYTEAKRLFKANPAFFAASYLSAAVLLANIGVFTGADEEAKLKSAYNAAEKHLSINKLKDYAVKVFSLKALSAFESNRKTEDLVLLKELSILKTFFKPNYAFFSKESIELAFAFAENKSDRKSILALETALKEYDKNESYSEETARNIVFFRAKLYIQIARLWRKSGDIERANSIINELCEMLKRKEDEPLVETAFIKETLIELNEEHCALLLLEADLDTAKLCSDLCIKAQRQLIDKRAPLAAGLKLVQLYLTRAEDIEDNPDEANKFYLLAETTVNEYLEAVAKRRISAGSLEEKAAALFCRVEESFGGFLSRERRGDEARKKLETGLETARLLTENELYIGFSCAARLTSALAKEYLADKDFTRAMEAYNSALDYWLNEQTRGEKNRLEHAEETLMVYTQLAELKSKLGYKEEAKALYFEAVSFSEKENNPSCGFFKEKGLLFISLAEHYSRYSDDRRQPAKNKRLARAAFASGLRLADTAKYREDLRDILFDLNYPIGE